MKVASDDISGTVVKDNETYIVIDNTSLDNLVLSKTVLHPGKSTGGHRHPGQEEVYQFTSGHGTMEVGDRVFNVYQGDVALIPDGLFHKVHNLSTVEDLMFVCVFNGKRSH
jgi:mannose-6-phosphate isomerase-like protein (cupin superfamily)